MFLICSKKDLRTVLIYFFLIETFLTCSAFVLERIQVQFFLEKALLICSSFVLERIQVLFKNICSDKSALNMFFLCS